MNNIEIALYIIFLISFLLYWWVGKTFISQPDYNVPMIFKHPIIGKLLVISPQLGFLITVILGFIFTENGWWFLGAVILIIILFAPKPSTF